MTEVGGRREPCERSGEREGPAGAWLVTLLAAALVLGAVSGAGLPRAAHADGAWLDDQSVTWNTAGMAIPVGPGEAGRGRSALRPSGPAGRV